MLGGAIAGAATKSKPRLPIPLAERLVLGPGDTPGLKPRKATRALAAKALASALHPARLPKIRGKAKTSYFVRSGAELWSLAYVLKSSRAAKAATKGFVRAARSARHRPRRTSVGQEGWAVSTRGQSALVVWRRRNGVGVILFRAKLKTTPLRSVATGYAAVADAHMARLLGLDAWQRTLGRIRPNGTMPRKVALDLFALAYSPLPGTKRPAGPRPRIPDATLAGWAILRIWPSLKPAQQAAAAKALGVTSVRLGRGAAARRPQRVGDRADWGDPTFVEDEELESLVNVWIAEYVKRLKIATVLKVVAGTSSDPTAEGLWDAYPIDRDGTVDDSSGYCRVRLLPEGRKTQDVELYTLAAAHEAFHCIEAEVMGNLAALEAPGWLIEGLAQWAGQTVRPVGWASPGNWQAGYLETPGQPLFARSYDAVGFFAHAEEVNGGLWSRVVPILEGKSNEARYAEARGLDPTLLNSWASSTFNRPEAGLDWTFALPLAPPPGLPTSRIPLWDSTAVQAQPYSLTRYVLLFPAEVAKGKLLHVQIAGYARLNDLNLDTTDLGDAWFSLDDEPPECPGGSSPPPAPRLFIPAGLALTGGPFGTSGTVELVSQKEYCKRKQKRPKRPTGRPAGGGCSGGCGSSNGDPHLLTFDTYFYDFQGAGEYVLARSRKGDFEIQAREEPYPGIKDLSVNTAIAMRVGGSRVAVHKGFPNVVVRVNRRGFVPTRRAQVLPGGGRIRRVLNQTEVVWPDGTLARLWPVGPWGVAILVKPAKARRGTLQGLLGNFDGNRDNDFVTRSGRRLKASVAWRSYRLLYRVFGDSWRIRQRQSLFDYARGQSTRTFTNRRYPSRILFARNLPPSRRAVALRFCRSLQIRNPQVFQACVLDVTGTGDGSFATAAAQLERTAGPGLAKPQKATTPKKPGKRTNPASAKGLTTWSRTPGKASGPLSLALVGDKVVVAYRSGQGTAEAITFTPSTGKDVVGLRRDTIASGWDTIGDPLLLDRAGGGLQALLTGIHSNDGSDPLNGVSFAARNADGSFAAPVPATKSTYAEFLSGDAALAPDGAPLWASTRGGTLFLWRGATGSVGNDLSGLAGGQVDSASVGRDRSGRYWLAWHAAFSSQPARVGLYLLQIDPASLKPIGTPQQAPASGFRSYSRLALACRDACRFVYLQPRKSGQRVVSWAPGERSPTIIANSAPGHTLGEPAAAYAANGRLWAAWWDNGGNAGYGYRAVLGNVRGAGGRPFAVGRPPKGDGVPPRVIASGKSLVIMTTAGTSVPYVNVAAPRR